jgi:hypothetical protein
MGEMTTTIRILFISLSNNQIEQFTPRGKFYLATGKSSPYCSE